MDNYTMYSLSYGTLMSHFSYLVSVKRETQRLLDQEQKGVITPERMQYLSQLIQQQQQRVNEMYYYFINQYPYLHIDVFKKLVDLGMPYALKYKADVYSQEYIVIPVKEILEYYMASDNYEVASVMLDVEALMNYTTLYSFYSGNTEAAIAYSQELQAKGVSYTIHPGLNVLRVFEPKS